MHVFDQWLSLHDYSLWLSYMGQRAQLQMQHAQFGFVWSEKHVDTVCNLDCRLAEKSCISSFIYLSATKGIINVFSAMQQHLSWRESCVTIVAHLCD